MKNEILLKAQELLANTRALTMTSIDLNGYPRPIAMAILRKESLRELWFVTPLDSEKVKHYRANSKAGVTFFDDKENVTLVGDMTIVTDLAIKKKYWAPWVDDFYPGGSENEQLCLLKFEAVSGMFVFEEKLYRCDFSNED